nr:ribonuclease H-like domain-containing protein [Tanacetum cinerariifolium]
MCFSNIGGRLSASLHDGLTLLTHGMDDHDPTHSLHDGLTLLTHVFVIMSFYGYSDGEYDDGSDANNVTLISKLYVSHPLHLHPNDYVALTVVSVKLKRTENYQVWSCAMLLALEGKNKTRFIDGSCRRSSILSRETLPDVRSAYAIISSEESHMIATGSVSGTLQRQKLDMYIEQSVPGLNNEDFFNLDSFIDHSEVPYDDERSDPSPGRYGTPSSHSGSTSDTHNENEGGYSLGSDVVASENDRDVEFFEDIFSFKQKMDMSIEQFVPGLNNEDFFNLDSSIDHSEIPYDDERSDPSPSRQKLDMYIEQSVPRLNNEDFFNLDSFIDHSEVPYDDERSDPS